MSRPFEVIATVSERVCTNFFLTGFVKRGATIFRINGSHTSAKEATKLIRTIRRIVGCRSKILIDLPGNKVRLSHLKKSIKLQEGIPFTLRKSEFNFQEFFHSVSRKHILLACDSMIQFKLVNKDNNTATFIPIIPGVLTLGTGVNVRGEQSNIPFLNDKDYALVEIAKRNRIEFLGFSYIRKESDVDQAKNLLKDCGVKSICKIETSDACKKLESIVPKTEIILIDRGDLSSEIGIHQVPHQLKRIMRVARQFKKKTFLATQFLHYMNEHPIPSISEVVALHEVLQQADGIQLSGETAIGKYPFQALETIQQSLFAIHQQ